MEWKYFIPCMGWPYTPSFFPSWNRQFWSGFGRLLTGWWWTTDFDHKANKIEVPSEISLPPSPHPEPPHAPPPLVESFLGWWLRRRSSRRLSGTRRELFSLWPSTRLRCTRRGPSACWYPTGKTTCQAGNGQAAAAAATPSPRTPISGSMRTLASSAPFSGGFVVALFSILLPNSAFFWLHFITPASIFRIHVTMEAVHGTLLTDRLSEFQQLSGLWVTVDLVLHGETGAW